MADFLIAVFGGILVLAALQALLPVVVGALDAVLGFIVKAPFRWLAHRIRSRSQLTPYRLGLRRASEGAFVATACIYAATWFPVFLGGDVFDLAHGLTSAPTDYPGAAAFFAALLLGLIWLVVGLRGARGGDRDPMSALWSAAIFGGCGAALWWRWYPSWPDWAYGTLLVAALKGFYLATGAAGLARLWLTMPLPSPALAAVNRVLRQRNSPMVAARRRRFFFR